MAELCVMKRIIKKGKQMMKRVMIFLLFAACVSGTAYADTPVFDEHSAEITNRYFPISAGKVLIYNLYTKVAGQDPTPTGMVNYWHCVGTEIVDGVKCLKVNRVTRVRGATSADNYDNALSSDWYAQSTDGSVYLLQFLNYHKPKSEFTTYGKANALLSMLPEIVVEAVKANPQLDTRITFEDLTLGATGLGTFKGCVKASQNQLIGTVYFARDIGPVLNINLDGNFNELIGWEFPLERKTASFDINGDGRIGLEEVIYGLRVVAGLSSVSGSFTLSAGDFPNGNIPAKYSCSDSAVSPPLSWANPPEGTKSFVLIMDNLDALLSKGYSLDHWLIYDLPASTAALSENAAAGIPSGAKQGTNSEGAAGYLKPCPPSGAPVTRYSFKLYALDIAALNPSHTNKAGIQAAMIGHVIGQTELVATASPLR
jgi:Raf kinase inhibitor-like YbhB/YbcL family protein